mmetsp:Transcript_1452/g.4182  ORF Transcript_1452/g.4182 Transcript_1452/m.4182 type:complete len:226 (+) Transcript_1452:1699-2376(+)
MSFTPSIAPPALVNTSPALFLTPDTAWPTRLLTLLAVSFTLSFRVLFADWMSLSFTSKCGNLVFNALLMCFSLSSSLIFTPSTLPPIFTFTTLILLPAFVFTVSSLSSTVSFRISTFLFTLASFFSLARGCRRLSESLPSRSRTIRSLSSCQKQSTLKLLDSKSGMQKSAPCPFSSSSSNTVWSSRTTGVSSFSPFIKSLTWLPVFPGDSAPSLASSVLESLDNS